jgi:hypothetical protein
MWLEVGFGMFVVMNCLYWSGKVEEWHKLYQAYCEAKKPVSQAIKIRGNVYMIDYLHHGGRYTLYFPIREVQNLSSRIVSVSNGWVSMALVQQDGVPFLVQPGDFGPDYQGIVFDEDNDNMQIIAPGESFPI